MPITQKRLDLSQNKALINYLKTQPVKRAYLFGSYARGGSI